MNEWTIERLEKMTPTARGDLYANAVRLASEEGIALALLIRQSGLSLIDSEGITGEHPIVRRMDEIINSDEGRAACKKAVEDGFPALAGADPMLAEEFPADYGKHNETTVWAGYLVADAMRGMGFTQQGKQGKMPDGCVARTGEMWKR